MIGKQIRVKGLVQGVGFRPTVWIIANKLKLPGGVLNDGQGVLIELFTSDEKIKKFIRTLKQECPPLARIDSIEVADFKGKAPIDFSIVPSKVTTAQTGIVPDASTCQYCIDDTINIDNRRYRYPFTNCTHCGPRLTIIKAIPYDRKNTSMSPFILCDECQKEYQHPADRRFHAQPNACPVCGPKVELIPTVNNSKNDIENTIKLLKQGNIIAIKGIGGFHLSCDANNKQAIQKLRQRKKRNAKPFALMAKNIETIKKYCNVNAQEKKLLESSVAPIVLLSAKKHNLPQEIAPGQNTLGFMLPYTPLHHLILQDLEFPLVMTSGNCSDIPQCIDNQDALNKLKNIADYWLFNNRDIVNRVDDSVVRVVNNCTQVLRRARGYAPTSMALPKGFENSPDVLACGGELKNTFCLVKDGLAILSQHIGDLKNADTYADYEKTLSLFQNLYQHKPEIIATDAHPDYLSSKYGEALALKHKLKSIKVQHHHAHIASALAENSWSLNQGKVLGIALDGIGYGDDESLWGGEFLLADYQSSQRLARLKPIALLGGAQAMYQPWRNTYAQLLSNFDWQQLEKNYGHLKIIKFLKNKPYKTLDVMLKKNTNSPVASSCGRLFDAMAAVLGICREQVQYEGQAAIETEALVTANLIEQESQNGYDFTIEHITENSQDLLQIQTFSFWQSVLNDLNNNTDKAVMATRFHLGLINVIVKMVKTLINSTNSITRTIVLSGGVFQNKILFHHTKEQLEQDGYNVLVQSQIPANDGGIALGQALIAAAQQLEKKKCV